MRRRYGGTLVDDGEMDLEEMLTVFYAILLSTLGLGDAQLAFPKVAQGKQAVARVFRGLSSRTDTAPHGLPDFRVSHLCPATGC